MGLLGKIGLALLFAASAWAQNVIGVRAGLISYAEGSVYIGEDRLEFNEYSLREVKNGESLRTDEGRVEIQLGPGAVLRMGEGGMLRMEDSRLAHMQLLIEDGSILVEIFERVKDNKLKIRVGEAVIEFKETGLYRLDGGQSQLRVYGGKAEIRQAGKKVTVKKGKAADLTTGLKLSKFDTKEFDLLHIWAALRSYSLYDTSKESRASLKHWTHLVGGYMQNENYNVRVYSETARIEQEIQLEQHRQLLQRVGRQRQIEEQRQQQGIQSEQVEELKRLIESQRNK